MILICILKYTKCVSKVAISGFTEVKMSAFNFRRKGIIEQKVIRNNVLKIGVGGRSCNHGFLDLFIALLTVESCKPKAVAICYIV